jgi:hypothetical protein
MKRLVRVVLIGLLGLLVLCIAAAGISALSNRRLPTQSTVVDKLDPFQKARLAEVQHLRQALGDAVWPGWSEADIPIITYNEGYAFLVGASDPPAGWVKAPSRERVGGSWEATPGDAFLDQPYYRQPLPDPDATPENFTVQECIWRICCALPSQRIARSLWCKSTQRWMQSVLIAPPSFW